MGLADPAPPEYEVEIYLDCHGPCKREGLPSSMFTRRKDTQRGYQYECRECRRKMNKDRKAKKRAERPKREPKPKKEGAKKSGETTEQRRKRPNKRTKAEYRQKLKEEAGLNIAVGKLIADTPRAFHFALMLILEEQLRLFHERLLRTIPGRVNFTQLLETTLFALRSELTRLNHRVTMLKTDEDARISATANLLIAEKERALRLLGLSPGASQEEIRKAYKKLARVAHPDHGGSVERMQRINAAYSLLMEGNNGRNGSSIETHQGAEDPLHDGDQSGKGPGAEAHQAEAL